MSRVFFVSAAFRRSLLSLSHWGLMPLLHKSKLRPYRWTPSPRQTAALERWLSAQTPVHEVERVPFRSIESDEDFIERYARPSRPVILTGAIDQWEAMKLTAGDLKARFGSTPVQVRPPDYARRNTPTSMTLSAYIDAVEARARANDTPFYVGNNKLTPEMARAMGPLPFAHLMPGEPRVWIGPANTLTPLHRDWVDNVFAQVVGRKRWRIYSPADGPYLYSQCPSSLELYMDISQVDAEKPDYDRFPLARRARQIDLVLEPGEVLFLPGGWFHHVRSLEFSLSLNCFANQPILALDGPSRQPRPTPPSP